MTKRKFTAQEYQAIVNEIHELDSKWEKENSNTEFTMEDFSELIDKAIELNKEKKLSLKDGTLELQKMENCPPMSALDAYALSGGYFSRM